MAEQEKENISKSLSELQEIVNWFEKQENVDVEKGLEKVKDGANLIKELRERLQKVENEFKEIKENLSSEDAAEKE
ncbi:exodeoxyribonuclease VII small subunit [Patescibacteria group bacterium]|nr:exodeoxyribonuclease VII small subunit [Patescibacteria group bacterium]